jgi:methionyl-tRNA formyltransferase
VIKRGLRLAFAGTPVLAATILDRLLQQRIHAIKFVITRPDRPAGRGRKPTPSPVKTLAENHGLAIKQPTRPQEIDPDLALADIDALVVAAFGMILPAEILHRPKLGCINVHTSLLPRWRGAAPIQRAIQAGDKITGVTIMQIEADVDKGDILLQRECVIDPDDTAGSLHDKLAHLGATCLLEALDGLAQNTLVPLKQDDQMATYANKLTKQEAIINWNRPALELVRTVRAFNPVPIAHTVLHSTAMRIWEADCANLKTTTAPPGTVLSAGTDGILVATATDALRIKRLQLPGKKVMSAGEFVNGHPGWLKFAKSKH